MLINQFSDSVISMIDVQDWNDEYVYQIYDLIHSSDENQNYFNPSSSIEIFSNMFLVNRTYQWTVRMAVRQDPSTRYIGSLLIRIEESSPRMITIEFVFIKNLIFHLIVDLHLF